MITDVFIKRYPQKMVYQDKVPPPIGKLFRQAALIIFDVIQNLAAREAFFERIHNRLARELGHWLYQAESYEESCSKFLAEPFDLWNNRHGTADYFFKSRLSLIELLFRELELEFTGHGRQGDKASATLRQAIVELNFRMREAQLPFHFHNGMLQLADDTLTTKQIAEPFWEIVHNTKWSNVDMDMKEAVDRRDIGERDAVLYALKALESTIKIISGEKGWTRGNEKGAANYIDNLVSAAHGQFIAAWEAEALKLLFRELRNPHGHGPGSQPQPTLSTEQTAWVIESAMSWIKSLVRRM